VGEPTGTQEDWDDFYYVFHLFRYVREFVAQRFPRLKRVEFNPLCREILKFRTAHSDELKGRRAMMHVAHHPNIICAWAHAVLRLSANHLVGLFLHEFGHLGSRGNDQQADRWVKKHFGIEILYGGPLNLEWVSPEDGKRALSVRPTRRPRRRRPEGS